MKIVTVAVEDKLYEKAESAASRRHMTMGDLVREALRAAADGRAPSAAQEQAEQQQRMRLVDLLEQCQIDLTERPTREATYASLRFH